MTRPTTRNWSMELRGIACAAVAGGAIFALAAPAAADPISPAPDPATPGGAAPIIVVATPGNQGGQPTLVISPPTDTQPQGPSRVNPIGGARISSSTPVEMGPGNGKPLLESQPRTQATVPVWARNGIFVRTSRPGKDVTVHLPDEMLLTAADWGPNGIGTYNSNDASYTVVPLPDGGADFYIHRKNPFAPTNYEFFLKLPAGTHWQADGSSTLIKSNEEGAPTIGTFSAPTAKNDNGAPVPVTVAVSPLAELNIDADAAEHPVDISFNYHPAP
ncbi:Uncharacterised protein [Mycobacteroides abscessus subsp. massiliense]|uniref:hypothetical protein n=1 Tax=Mycobacteroides abscessus TaxID=36809 RepID=UPI0009CC3970|nr:hypothetical protein [Mycobacteroides abscessus]SKQ92600.1 Uncharacterised protein [Mycobacteroides abscessus subsp. massiliense]SKR36655.1 Uncharacterised protein [Mycobacteroides abscessus subsp. massiliense]SKT84899.1 Uncharacterised protein [Mycobacteroides abscessus subsp. massiliense]SKU13965.1 Uncharacterised protein [Mycobacteroides abscessus subsp. massiliense]SLA37167.1 Uncharacterised protein [Mycobacteroides abscessus subsp. massiliense]